MCGRSARTAAPGAIAALERKACDLSLRELGSGRSESSSGSNGSQGSASSSDSGNNRKSRSSALVSAASAAAASAAAGAKLRSSASYLGPDVGKDWRAAAQQVQDEERRRESKMDEAAPAAKPVRVRRAKEWSPEVEDCFRLQHSGWRDLCEYIAAFGEPDRWGESGFIKCTRIKGSGFYTYWRPYREAEDKSLASVKVFEYA